MTLTTSSKNPQTLEITEKSVYINGNHYERSDAVQVACHLNAMGMLDATSLNSWLNALTLNGN